MAKPNLKYNGKNVIRISDKFLINLFMLKTTETNLTFNETILPF